MKACPYCAEQIQDAAIVCRFCQRSLTSRPVPLAPTVAATGAPARTWNPGIAAVLSFFIPGLGQLYKGQIGVGLFLLVFTLIGYAALIVPGLFIHIAVIVNAYRAPTSADRMATRATTAAQPAI